MSPSQGEQPCNHCQSNGEIKEVDNESNFKGLRVSVIEMDSNLAKSNAMHKSKLITSHIGTQSNNALGPGEDLLSVHHVSKRS